MCLVTLVHWGKPLHTHLYLALYFVVTDFTDPPHTITHLVLCGISMAGAHTSATGYHEPHKG